MAAPFILDGASFLPCVLSENLSGTGIIIISIYIHGIVD
jgi:hypothetical protein